MRITNECILLISFSIVLSVLGYSQQEQYSFVVQSYTINNYGQRTESFAVDPVVLKFNTSKLHITMTSTPLEIAEFLSHQSQFEIVQAKNNGIISNVYLTTTGFVFSINTSQKSIVISRNDIPLNNYSLSFTNIEFDQ